MPSNPNSNGPLIADLMDSVRKLTRSTLILQHIIAQAMGLNVTDAECLDFLQEMGPSTAGDLAKATRLTTGAITSMIDRLEKSGFVKRSPDPTDRRKVIVTFLPDKHIPAGIHYAALSGAVHALFTGYTGEELKFLSDHTKALTDIYQRQVKNIESPAPGLDSKKK